jgi:NADP-dependent 3-hydroxy acid dehydrogenase YdfG
LADSVKDMPGELLSIKCDLSKQNEILSMFSEIQSKWGGVDVCINNAGVCIDALIIDGDPEAWRTMLDVS